LRNAGSGSVYYIADRSVAEHADVTTNASATAAALRTAGYSECKSGEAMVIEDAPPFLRVVCANGVTATAYLECGMIVQQTLRILGGRLVLPGSDVLYYSKWENAGGGTVTGEANVAGSEAVHRCCRWSPIGLLACVSLRAAWGVRRDRGGRVRARSG
jgi:hypothetical protein